LENIFLTSTGSAMRAAVAGVSVVAMAMQLAVTWWRPSVRATPRLNPAAPAFAPA